MSRRPLDLPANMTMRGGIVVPKAMGIGMLIDIDDPGYGWRDLEGVEVVDVAGLNRAILKTLVTDIREYSFASDSTMDLRFHIPHDYAPGTDLFFHVHWCHNGTAISGNFTPTLKTTYAKGHQQDIWAAAATPVMDYDTVDIATTPQLQHMITEVPLSIAGGSASTLDTNEIEIDGLILISLVTTVIPTISGGTVAAPFVHRCDIHYQSTNLPTKQKSPNFYV